MSLKQKFINNTCEIKVPISKKIKNYKSCDIFIHETVFVLVCDVEQHRFNCVRKFDLTNIKNVSICFNSELWEFTCTLPCVEKESKIETRIYVPSGLFKRITDSCVLSVDGVVCDIEADFPYGFSEHYRGKPEFNEDDLSRICRITNPNCLSHLQRTIQRENDENKEFNPEEYLANLVLPIPEGHENPITFEIPYDDVGLSAEDNCILEKVISRHANFNCIDEKIGLDCCLIDVLLGICYDVRFTTNDPTCGSTFTRSILSSCLSYFEQFKSIQDVVRSFMRRSLIYPFYRNYDLSKLCVQDVVVALTKGKPWILKQLFVTYNCFRPMESYGKPLNKYFISHLIWYVDQIMDDGHFNVLSSALKDEIPNINMGMLQLGLDEIMSRLLSEMVDKEQESESEESDSFDEESDLESISSTQSCDVEQKLAELRI